LYIKGEALPGFPLFISIASPLLTLSEQMQFLHSDKIPIPHGMFSRHHGTSSPPFSSLNVSHGVGDTTHCVQENRRRIKNILNIDVLLSARQVHGCTIHVDSGTMKDHEVEGCDALITDQPGIGLLIQQADCQALLVHDPIREVIAAIHCGWRGNVANIIESTIEKMRDALDVNPANLRVVISPSLGPCCAEFVNHPDELPEHFQPFLEAPDHFNFWRISAKQLIDTGVMKDNIEVKEICTCCSSDYFSYRRAVKKGQPTTGRQASVICLPN
jgi:YfiH family protein